MNMQTKGPMRVRGFTLIELMAVVAIIGVIAAIAFPQYQKSARKTDRADGKTTLVSLGQVMERCYTQSFTYKNCTTLNGGTTQANSTSPRGYYTISVPAATTTTYTVMATAVSTGPQAKDTGCTILTMTNTGAQNSGSATATTDTGGCW